MNTYTSAIIDRLTSLTEAEFHNDETRANLLKELMHSQQLLCTVQELLCLNSTELLSVDEIADLFQESSVSIQALVEENQKILTLDGMSDQYLSTRAVFRLASLLPNNPIAQECVSQLLNIALR